LEDVEKKRRNKDIKKENKINENERRECEKKGPGVGSMCPCSVPGTYYGSFFHFEKKIKKYFISLFYDNISHFQIQINTTNPNSSSKTHTNPHIFKIFKKYNKITPIFHHSYPNIHYFSSLSLPLLRYCYPLIILYP
jgi:hypothetical protein